MRRRNTILETFQPLTGEFVRLARTWRADASVLMLEWVWAGYDLLVAEVFSKANWNKAKDDIEREITQLLEPRIRRCMPEYTFCYVQHEPKERETRELAPEQPPEYDLAFVLLSNERIMWPMEAKVLETDRRIGEYASEVKGNFLTCRYAPFSSEGAMLGYLLSGAPDAALANIAAVLNARLVTSRHFQGRHHRTSSHCRQVPVGKSYPREFLCHHLIMPIQ